MRSWFVYAVGTLGSAFLVGCAADEDRIPEERDSVRGDGIELVDASVPSRSEPDASIRSEPSNRPDASARTHKEPTAQRDAGAVDPVPDPERVMDAAMALPGPTEPDASSEPLPSCLPFSLPDDCEYPPNSSLPTSLRCAGLYADIARGVVSCGLSEYAPAYELWSDGAVKRRWVGLPEGSSIDTRDPDGFVYPVGTEFWKEFQVRRDGELRRAETRLLRKVPRGWVLATYVWAEDGRSATLTNDGVASWQGSGHTVPTRDQCVECHAGRKDLVLGWDPVLLGPGAKGLHLEDLAITSDDDAGVPPLSAAMPPGDPVEQAALGYLHVNCGVSCHNDSIDARARDTALYLRLVTGRAESVLNTPAVLTAINKRPTGNAPFYELPEPAEGSFYDLLPGSPARSLLLARMLVRDHPAQMPPLASNVIDEQGTAAVSAWIASMTPERGYPAAALDDVTEPAGPLP